MIAIPRDAFYAVNPFPFSLGTYDNLCLLLWFVRTDRWRFKLSSENETKNSYCYVMCWVVAIIAFAIGILVAGVVAAGKYGSRLPSEGFLLQCRCDDDCQLSPLPPSDDQDIEMCSIYRVTCDTAKNGDANRNDNNSTNTLLAKFDFTFLLGTKRFYFYTHDDDGPCLLWKSEEFAEINGGNKLDLELFTVVSPFTAEALRKRSPLSVADFVALEDEGLFRPEMMGSERAEQRLTQVEVARKWALACAVRIFSRFSCISLLIIIITFFFYISFDEFRVLLAHSFAVCFCRLLVRGVSADDIAGRSGSNRQCSAQ